MLSFEPVSRPRTLIVADDLTGACDGAVAFAQRGARTQVLLDGRLPVQTDYEVCALCTESRHLLPERAYMHLRQLAESLGGQSEMQIFKKIDSVFRGNTFHEIRATIDALPDRQAVIAPAYPALGRVAEHGNLHVRDLSGHRSIDVREGFHLAGLAPHWISAGIGEEAVEHQLRQARGEAVFCDATQQGHLDAVVRAAHALQSPLLWIGSAGLAHALATDAYPAKRQRSLADETSGIMLVFVGSDHPVTLRQVEALQTSHSVSCHAGDPSSVVLVPVDHTDSSPSCVRDVASSFAPEDISCLFMTGGDTALLVCRALGIEALCLHDEFEPGIPQGTASGGPFAGCNVILKSGGFGEAETISRIAARFSRQEISQ